MIGRLAGHLSAPGQSVEEDDMAVSKHANPDSSEVEVKEYGKYIVADPRICHGKWTIRGTRILVSVVLEQVAEGLDWDTIGREWRGKVSRGAIREAILLAHDALSATTGEERTATGLGMLSAP
jgi:uncharacterized protein (DUF433 family)